MDGGNFGHHFLLKSRSKLGPFFERLWKLSGAILGGFLAVLALSWEAWCSRNPVNNESKCMFSKSFVIAILAVLDCFRGPSWLISGRFGPQNWDNESIDIGTKSGQRFSNPLGNFWDNFGGNFGGNIFC